jgi:hypothetical protein
MFGQRKKQDTLGPPSPELRALGAALQGLLELPREEEQEVYRHPFALAERARRTAPYGAATSQDVERWQREEDLPLDAHGRIGERRFVQWLRAKAIDALLSYARRTFDDPAGGGSARGRAASASVFYWIGAGDRLWPAAHGWINIVRPTLAHPPTLALDYKALRTAEALLPPEPPSPAHTGDWSGLPRKTGPCPRCGASLTIHPHIQAGLRLCCSNRHCTASSRPGFDADAAAQEFLASAAS